MKETWLCIFVWPNINIVHSSWQSPVRPIQFFKTRLPFLYCKMGSSFTHTVCIGKWSVVTLNKILDEHCQSELAYWLEIRGWRKCSCVKEFYPRHPYSTQWQRVCSVKSICRTYYPSWCPSRTLTSPMDRV